MVFITAKLIIKFENMHSLAVNFSRQGCAYLTIYNKTTAFHSLSSTLWLFCRMSFRMELDVGHDGRLCLVSADVHLMEIGVLVVEILSVPLWLDMHFSQNISHLGLSFADAVCLYSV